MGFSRSLSFCQDAVEHWLGSLSLTRQSRILKDRSGVAVFDTSKYQDSSAEEHHISFADYHYAYVDNMGVLAARTETVADALSEAKSVFEPWFSAA